MNPNTKPKPFRALLKDTFGIDCDEIYDPEGLKILKEQLYSGKYNDYHKLMGRHLHCTYISENREKAEGYIKGRIVTKLYNFNFYVTQCVRNSNKQ